MNFGIWWCVVATAAMCGADKWQWPDQAASVRIDTKVRFTDGQEHDTTSHGSQVQADEVFHEAGETAGFYNRPPGAGRYPVHVEAHPYRVDTHSVYSLHNAPRNQNDGTLDSLQYCKCISTPDCNPRHDYARACGSGKFLCCYKKQNKMSPQQTAEYFNEIDDERPSLLPGREEFARPFPPPPNSGFEGAFGHEHTNNPALVGSADRGLLDGLGGPTGNIGNSGLLVSPGGPSGVIGPVGSPKRTPDVLVGPEGPTGVIGPTPISDSRGHLIRPSGPRDVGPSESAQRGVLVGPGGPTGIIGPGRRGQRPVLVGPGGPTGIIGPRMRGYYNNLFNQYGRQGGPGILVGPGGPTGMIGPGRPLLVGPGGPTGQIGPINYFG